MSNGQIITQMMSLMYHKLQSDLDAIRKDMKTISKIANEPREFRDFTLATAPSALLTATITDGRKPGESATNGTGVPAWQDLDTHTWYSLLDGSVVQI